MKKKKIMIIGLDGATFDLIDPFVNEGKLPNISKLINNGVKSNLKSTIPPITPAAWISLFTGKNPGAHGVFNFRTFDLKKYSAFNEEFVTSAIYAGQSIFDIFSDNGYKVASIGTPMTYPPFKINGYMVASGAPRMVIDELSVFPAELIGEIGKLEIPVKFGRKNRAYFKEYITKNIEKHLFISKYLLNRENFDLFMIVFGNTDWVAHQFWECTDTNYPTYNSAMAEKYGSVIEEQYILVDKAIGELLNFVDEDTYLFVISDHGNGPHPVNCVNINYWLREKGILSLKNKLDTLYTDHINNMTKALRDYVSRNKNVQKFIKKILPHGIKSKISTLRLNVNNIQWNMTKAYAIPIMPMFDGIILNIKNKQPNGIVESGEEYEHLRDELMQGLADIKDPADNKKTVIKNIYRKEDIYHGKHLDNAPDLIIHYNENYTGGTRLKDGLFSKIENYTLDNNSSSHRLEGILIAYGKHIKKNYQVKDAHIIDILPTILYIMDMPIFDDIDGKVLMDIFENEFIKSYEVQKRNEINSFNSALNKAEENEIKNILKGLGYIE